MSKVEELTQRAFEIGKSYAALVNEHPMADRLYVGIHPRENWDLNNGTPEPQVIGLYLLTKKGTTTEEERHFYRLAVTLIKPEEFVRVTVFNPKYFGDTAGMDYLQILPIPRSVIGLRLN